MSSFVRMLGFREKATAREPGRDIPAKSINRGICNPRQLEAPLDEMRHSFVWECVPRKTLTAPQPGGWPPALDRPRVQDGRDHLACIRVWLARHGAHLHIEALAPDAPRTGPRHIFESLLTRSL